MVEASRMLTDVGSRAAAERAEDEWISISRASQLLGVSLPTLRRWSDEGRVPSVRTLGGHRRYSLAAIQSLQSLQSLQARPTSTSVTALESARSSSASL